MMESLLMQWLVGKQLEAKYPQAPFRFEGDITNTELISSEFTSGDSWSKDIKMFNTPSSGE